MLAFKSVSNPNGKVVAVNELLGRTFSLEEENYTIVDVRKIDGEMMVYAEQPGAAKGPGRAAFRFADIEGKISEQEVA